MTEPVEKTEKADENEEIEEAVEEKLEKEEVEEAGETERVAEAEEVEEKGLEGEEKEAVAEAEVEEKVKEAKKEEKEEEIVEERVYTIPLGRAWISPRKKRTPRATRLIKSFIERHMKPEALVISNEVNEKIWSRGIEKPPRKIRVRAAKDREGTVTLYLAEEGD
jgi:large subunit ribosomal protein L31e